MLICPKCGAQNPADVSNCIHCHINLAYALANPEAFAPPLVSPETLAAAKHEAELEEWAASHLDKWQYKAIQQPFKQINIDAINSLGLVGWELVTVMPSTKTSGLLTILGIEGFTNTDSVVFFMRRRVPVSSLTAAAS